MKILASWLQELVGLTAPVKETAALFAQQLTDVGIEVESLEWLSDSDDCVMEIKTPPNRGDCLSVLGIAREVAFLNKKAWKEFVPNIIPERASQKFPVELNAGKACPHYCSRIITHLNPEIQTPDWMRRLLERSGYLSNSLIVDITNYVMLEIGQPLHAFDLTKLDSKIVVRFAYPEEKLLLLNDKTVTLSTNTLVVADAKQVHAIAGIMGGLYSAVSEKTNAICLESAFFNSVQISLAARHYNLRTEASYRFERQVDPMLARAAIERATELLLQCDPDCLPGPVNDTFEEKYSFSKTSVFLRHTKIEHLLGISLPKQTVENIFHLLGFSYNAVDSGWEVVIPSFRGDILIEEDLIEELARVYGYAKIPSQPFSLPISRTFDATTGLSILRVKQLLSDKGYHEALTFSFTKPELLEDLGYNSKEFLLTNPISEELAALRPAAWIGLFQAALYNYRRQQPRIRYFEISARFEFEQGKLSQRTVLAGLCMGKYLPLQWGEKERLVDFFDVKGDIESLLSLTNHTSSFEPRSEKALHPHQAATIICSGKKVGYLGAVHPEVLQRYDLKDPLFVFEIDLSSLLLVNNPSYRPLSKYPSVRRDLSMIVDHSISIQKLQNCIEENLGSDLKEVKLFDLYQGKGIPIGKKSLTFCLTLQNDAHTMTDAVVELKIKEVLQRLIEKFQIALRE